AGKSTGEVLAGGTFVASARLAALVDVAARIAVEARLAAAHGDVVLFVAGQVVSEPVAGVELAGGAHDHLAARPRTRRARPAAAGQRRASAPRRAAAEAPGRAGAIVAGTTEDR